MEMFIYIIYIIYYLILFPIYILRAHAGSPTSPHHHITTSPHAANARYFAGTVRFIQGATQFIEAEKRYFCKVDFAKYGSSGARKGAFRT